MANNNNLNWLGNKVIDSNQQHKPYDPDGAGASMPSAGQSQAPIQTPQELQYAFPQVPSVQYGAAPMSIQGPPPPAAGRGYIPGYLASNIGKNVRAEFIINNTNVDRTGRLIEVGVNYFVLEDVNSRTHIMCDLYSVKFVTVLQM